MLALLYYFTDFIPHLVSCKYLYYLEVGCSEVIGYFAIRIYPLTNMCALNTHRIIHLHVNMLQG